jgi:hypothetical protein
MLKKTIAIFGTLLVVGTGMAVAQSARQARNRNEFRSRAETRSEVRARFVDENGDGINDLYRDHDNDGIPNCRDTDWQRLRDGSGNGGGFGGGSGNGINTYGPGAERGARNGGGANAFQRDDDGDGIPNGQDADWQRPLDGTGYKSRLGRTSFRTGAGALFGMGLSRGAFARERRNSSSAGICDGTGPRSISRRAR